MKAVCLSVVARKSHILVFLIFLVSCFATASADSKISISGLRQILRDAEPKVATTRLVYVEEMRDYSYKEQDLSGLPVCDIINMRKLTKRVVSIDVLTDRERTSRFDLRNIDDLIAEKGVKKTETMWRNISQTREHTRQGTLSLRFYRHPNNSDAVITRLQSSTIREARHLRVGIVPIGQLTEDSKIIPRKITHKKDPVLEIRIPQGLYEVFYTCDPSVGYRYSKKIEKRSGIKRKETVIGEYKSVDGVPFPFNYSIRYYDKNEELLKEYRYRFEKVEFGVELSEDEFRIAIPEGTRITNPILGDYCRLERRGLYSPSEFLGSKTAQIAMQLIQDELSINNQLWHMNKVNHILLPDARNTVNKNKPFVYDFEKGILVETPEETLLRSPEFNKYVARLGIGDIAWDGTLILLRGTSLRLKNHSRAKRMQVEKRSWGRFLNIATDIKLPLHLLITTAMGRSYDVRLKEISTEGVRLVVSPELREICVNRQN